GAVARCHGPDVRPPRHPLLPEVHRRWCCGFCLPMGCAQRSLPEGRSRMAFYILRRILQAIPVFFGATLLIYFMVFAMPGDPIAALFGDRQPNPALLERLRAEYHLDEPFAVRYFYYIAGIFQLDFGTSFSGQPVIDIL